jgi:uncharacterized membrane protein YkoI
MKSKYIITTAAAFALVAGLAVHAFAAEEKEEAITLDKVPKPVKEALAKYATDAEVKKVEKGDEDGKTVYEFDIEQGTRKYELSLSRKGKFMGTEEDMDLSAMPEAARKALTDQATGGKLSGGEKAVDKNNKVTYEADIEKNGKKTEVAVDADGKVISTEAAGAEKD